MPANRFILGMVLACYAGFSRLNHLRFLDREPMLAWNLNCRLQLFNRIENVAVVTMNISRRPRRVCASCLWPPASGVTSAERTSAIATTTRRRARFYSSWNSAQSRARAGWICARPEHAATCLIEKDQGRIVFMHKEANRFKYLPCCPRTTEIRNGSQRRQQRERHRRSTDLSCLCA